MSDMATCRGCGVLADTAVQWYERQAAIPLGGGPPVPAARFQRSTCPDCATLDFTRPGVAVRAALRLIGRPETDDTLFAEVLLDNEFDAALLLYPGGEPNRRPWAHAHDLQRDLRRLYTLALIKKVERSLPPVPVPPPLGRGHEADRCLICGRAEDLAWHGFATLSMPGGASATGCICASNCGPVMSKIGVFGTQFEGNCYLAAHGEPLDLGLDRIVGLRPWYRLSADQQAAVKTPFDWVPTAPEPMSPIGDQGPTVEALAAQVATLQNELALMRGAQG